MEWIDSLFTIHSAVQTLVVLALIISVGMALGKLRIRGISLGVAFVFFMGIVAGSLHFTADEQMVSFAETFGLSIFVYALGLHVGPNFIGMMRHDGASLNGWSMGVILLGTVMALSLCFVLPISIPDMVGILCGATTNTPALGAAQQALATQHISSSGAALGCAVTYPLGVVGVIFAMILLRKLFVRKEDLQQCNSSADDSTYVGQFICVNPAISGKTIAQISQSTHRHFIISRIWRDGKVIVPLAQTVMQHGDNVLVVTNRDEVAAMNILFGEHVEKDWNREKIDWNAIDSSVESRVIVMTRSRLNGKTLGSLHMRETYGVNVSRVMRGDIKLLATDSLHLQYGDRVTIVGTPEDINHAEAFLGNQPRRHLLRTALRLSTRHDTNQHTWHERTGEAWHRRRTNHHGYHHRLARRTHTPHHLHHALGIADAAQDGSVALPRLPRTRSRSGLPQHHHPPRGLDVGGHRLSAHHAAAAHRGCHRTENAQVRLRHHLRTALRSNG